MERKLVTVQKISFIEKIENADKIELATVLGWQVVILKDQFKVGELVEYFEIDSFLPVKPEYEFLLRGSKPKKMVSEGKEIEGIRLRTIKLRGQISQGLIMPLSEDLYICEEGEDITERLGVILYERPIPACLSGIAKGDFPSFIPKTDEIRVQSSPKLLGGYVVTEKIDGSSCTFYKKDGVFGVCSRNLELKHCESTQWKIARELSLEEILYDNFALQGELVGEGIQKNPYKMKGQKVYFFNAFNITSGKYLDHENFKEICDTLHLETVPILDENFALPQTVKEMVDYAEGKSMLNLDTDREGVVVRKKSSGKEGRISFKAISNSYLLKNEE